MDGKTNDDAIVDFLLKKKYLTPLEFTSSDQGSLDFHQRRKYSVVSSPLTDTDVFVETPQDRRLVTSGSVSSVQSVYSNIVEDNRTIKRKWESVRLSDLEKEMETNHSHFKSVSLYYAVFVNFIRFVCCHFISRLSDLFYSVRLSMKIPSLFQRKMAFV
jgi:hypothetical protein